MHGDVTPRGWGPRGERGWKMGFVCTGEVARLGVCARDAGLTMGMASFLTMKPGHSETCHRGYERFGVLRFARR